MADDEVRWVSSEKFSLRGIVDRDFLHRRMRSDNSRWFFFFFFFSSCKLILIDYFSPHFHAPLRHHHHGGLRRFHGFPRKMERWIFFHLGSCSKQLTKIERYALLVRFVLVKWSSSFRDRLIRRKIYIDINSNFSLKPHLNLWTCRTKDEWLFFLFSFWNFF